MKRIMIIGNSHVAALKAARDAETSSRAASFDFFAIRGGEYFAKLRLFDGEKFGLPNKKLAEHPKVADMLLSINGNTSVDLSQYDTVVLHGHATAISEIISIAGKYSIDQVRERGGSREISKSAFLDFCRDIASKRLPPRKLTNILGQKFFVSLAPVPSNTVANGDVEDRMRLWQKVAQQEISLARTIQEFYDVYKDLLAKSGVGFIKRPEATIDEMGLTKSEYFHGAIRVTDGSSHSLRDRSHMNAKYGRLVLDEIIKAVEK